MKMKATSYIPFHDHQRDKSKTVDTTKCWHGYGAMKFTLVVRVQIKALWGKSNNVFLPGDVHNP